MASPAANRRGSSETGVSGDGGRPATVSTRFTYPKFVALMPDYGRTLGAIRSCNRSAGRLILHWSRTADLGRGATGGWGAAPVLFARPLSGVQPLTDPNHLHGVPFAVAWRFHVAPV